MTSAGGRRLAKLEGALPPREAVLAWLVEAQLLSGLDERARRVVELPIEAAPLSVIARQVEAAARDAMKGRPRDAVEAAVHGAVRDAMFLFCLVFQINGAALKIAEVEGLRGTAAIFWMGCLLGGPRAADLTPAEATVFKRESQDAWGLWRSVVDRLGADLRVENEARATLEERFFGGRDVLLADVSERWAGHVDLIERLVGLAEDMPWTGTARARLRRPTGIEPSASVPERAAARAETVADDARVRAYEVLGDRPRAVEIMERRLTRLWAPVSGDTSL
jgi:hypothetical protein